MCSSSLVFSDLNWWRHVNNEATATQTDRFRPVNIMKYFTKTDKRGDLSKATFVLIGLSGYRIRYGESCVKRHSLSKCCACSIRNWLPCSHCRSNSWSSVWGTAALLFLFVVLPVLPLPLSAEWVELDLTYKTTNMRKTWLVNSLPLSQAYHMHFQALIRQEKIRFSPSLKNKRWKKKNIIQIF